MSETTMRVWFDTFTGLTGESLTHIVFTAWSAVDVWDRWDRDSWPGLVDGVLLDFADVPDSVLDRSFDCGYGGTNCVPFFAWSATFVLWPHEYDGAEWLVWVPRDPTARFTPDHGGIMP
jgi:hypothetical protein